MGNSSFFWEGTQGEKTIGTGCICRSPSVLLETAVLRYLQKSICLSEASYGFFRMLLINFCGLRASYILKQLSVQFFIWSCFFQDRQLPLCVLPSSQWFLLPATCSGSDHCLARLYLAPGAAQPLNLRIQIFLFLRRVSLPPCRDNSRFCPPSSHQLRTAPLCRNFPYQARCIRGNFRKIPFFFRGRRAERCAVCL